MKAMTVNVQLRPVVGYEGRYSVSRCGRVWSHQKFCHKGLWLKTSMSKGYFIVDLVNSGGKKKTTTVHKLVAAAFISARPLGLQVNHKNGDKLDNKASNLEYMTPGDNTRHAYATGLIDIERVRANGRRAATFAHALLRKLTPIQVRSARKKYYSGVSVADLARKYSIDKSTMFSICKRETYKDC